MSESEHHAARHCPKHPGVTLWGVLKGGAGYCSSCFQYVQAAGIAEPVRDIPRPPARRSARKTTKGEKAKMKEEIKTILDLTTAAHDTMKIDPIAAKQQISRAQITISRTIAKAEKEKRRGLADFAQSAAGYLDSMSRHDRYLSVFAGGLDALGRQGEQAAS